MLPLSLFPMPLPVQQVLNVDAFEACNAVIFPRLPHLTCWAVPGELSLTECLAIGGNSDEGVEAETALSRSMLLSGSRRVAAALVPRPLGEDGTLRDSEDRHGRGRHGGGASGDSMSWELWIAPNGSETVATTSTGGAAPDGSGQDMSLAMSCELSRWDYSPPSLMRVCMALMAVWHPGTCVLPSVTASELFFFFDAPLPPSDSSAVTPQLTTPKSDAGDLYRWRYVPP